MHPTIYTFTDNRSTFIKSLSEDLLRYDKECERKKDFPNKFPMWEVYLIHI